METQLERTEAEIEEWADSDSNVVFLEYVRNLARKLDAIHAKAIQRSDSCCRDYADGYDSAMNDIRDILEADQ